jgi:NADH:ubiquinone oxidoreductase subunit F (NADH-binding)
MSLPRLLAGVDGPRALSSDAHLAVHGSLPAVRGRRDRGSSPLIDEIRRSGLTGRGGAGFPTATKLEAVRAARGRPIVVVNGCEGEPASRKDRLLLEHSPHIVIDGALACARALDAGEIIFAVKDDAPASGRAIDTGLAERSDTGVRGLDATVVAVPTGYVTGQESAIVSFVNRGAAKPTAAPPMVFERGVGRRPTLVGNVETFAQIGLIARHGADWFRELGTHENPGSTLVTLSGGVARPGVFEIAQGSVLGSLVEAAGGLVAPLRAVLFGGYAGTWIDGPEALRTELVSGSPRAAGARLGPGVIVALPATACPVAETVRVAAWMAGQGAGQCGPCVHGLAAIAGTLSDLANGRGGPDAEARLAGWAGLVTGRGACAHPDGTARFVISGLRVFAEEFDDHARYGRCTACSAHPVLPVPERLALAAM